MTDTKEKYNVVIRDAAPKEEQETVEVWLDSGHGYVRLRARSGGCSQTVVNLHKDGTILFIVNSIFKRNR